MTANASQKKTKSLNEEIKNLNTCKKAYEKICPRNPKILRNAFWQTECLKQKENFKKLPPYCAKKFSEALKAQDKKIAVLSKKYKNKQNAKDSESKENLASDKAITSSSDDELSLEKLNVKQTSSDQSSNRLPSNESDSTSDNSSSKSKNYWGFFLLIAGFLGVAGWIFVRIKRKKSDPT